MARSKSQLNPRPRSATLASESARNDAEASEVLLLEQAQRLGLDPTLLRAIVASESSASAPFAPDGRMTIRFEPHIFWDRWGARHPDQFQPHFQIDSAQPWKGAAHCWRSTPDGPWQTIHDTQDSEWQVFEFARSLDETAAMLALSMGAAQIMGVQHVRLQYAKVQEMFNAFSQSARSQYEGVVDLIQASAALAPLQKGDLMEFARMYKGEAQAATYARTIQNNLLAFNQVSAVNQSLATGSANAEAQARSPQPASPIPGKPLIEADPQLYEAWSRHIQQGFENSQTMFSRILNSFVYPYWITVAMYIVLFAVGIVSFAMAIMLAFNGINAKPEANTTTIFGSSAIFGGLTVLSFLSYFIGKPLQSLEENLQFITWLGMIYNSYWTRMAYTQNLDTVQAEIEEITADSISQINVLLDKHTLLTGKRPSFQSEGSKTNG